VLFLDLPMMAGAAETDQFRIAAYASPWRAQAAYSSPDETGFTLSATIALPATVGVLNAGIGSGIEGRLDHATAMTVELYGGELASVSTLRLLNGANVAAVRADNGVWEVIQFAEAEEIAPSVWRLSRLLRGQLGTDDAGRAGASAGAPFVLIDDAVVKAGLASEQAGLMLNWRVGPIGHDFGGDSYVRRTLDGGLRALTPLSPVHLRLQRAGSGDAELTWIRRARLDADSWLSEDIPLGEEFERYRIEIAPAGGAVVRTM
jgi:hypothetical protein